MTEFEKKSTYRRYIHIKHGESTAYALQFPLLQAMVTDFCMNLA